MTTNGNDNGLFITIEGGEHTGKSTLLAAVRERWETLPIPVPELVVCRDPGGTEFGERIRRALFAGDTERPVPVAEMLVFAASRAQLVGEIVRPALQRGAVVVSDRFIDSTYAIQHYGRGVSLEMIRVVHAAARIQLPHMTLLLDRDPQSTSLRGPATDYMERESVEFHSRVREGFLHLAAGEPGRWRVLDASQPADAVAEQAWMYVRAELDDWPTFATARLGSR